MKKTFTTWLCACLCLMASAQDNFKMHGRLADLKDGTLTIEYKVMGSEVTLRTEVTDGEFTLSTHLDKGVSAKLGESLYLPLMPDEEMEISGTTEDFTLGGSKFYQDLERVYEVRRPFRRQQQAISEQYASMGKKEAEVLDEMRKDEMRAVNKAMSEAFMEYIRQHADEEAVVDLISLLDMDKIQPAIDLLTPEVRHGRLEDEISKLEDFAKHFARQR